MEINQTRIEILKKYIKGIREGKDQYRLNQKYKEEIEKTSPNEALQLFQYLLEESEPKESLDYMKAIINNQIHAFENIELELPEDQRFYRLIEESNMDLLKSINSIKDVICEDQEIAKKNKEVKSIFNNLKEDLEKNLEKQQLIFEQLEKTNSNYETASIMSSLHEKILEEISKFENREFNLIDQEVFYKIVGKIMFDLILLKYNTETILLPKACKELKEESWTEMFKQNLFMI